MIIILISPNFNLSTFIFALSLFCDQNKHKSFSACFSKASLGKIHHGTEVKYYKN